MMKFPYGICDFYKIITKNYFYVDRTDRIPLIENKGDHHLFLRPRRFGKSLLLSMLENYYDAAKVDEFDRIFGKLAIGKNPTPERNTYLVMNWDFSAVAPQGSPAEIKQALHGHINGCIEQFKARYHRILEYDIQIYPDNALRSFQSVLAAVQTSPYKLYLLIDEYDNFANEVLMGGKGDSKSRYENLIFGEGAMKTVFKAVKSATRGLGLDRAFITGVSPVVMSDITSGHNIAKNIYLLPEFNDLCGFRESEIQDALKPIAKKCRMSDAQASEALDMMRTFYNGYAFSYEQPPSVYNPTLAIYFLEHWHDYCRCPRRIMDSNLAMDKSKITYISRLAHGEKMIMNALNQQSPVHIDALADRFGVEDILSAVKDTPFMASLLYYFGVLTFSGDMTHDGELIFKIPNLVIRQLYVERIREFLLPKYQDMEDVRQAARTFYNSGDIRPLCAFVEQRYFKILDNRDYRWANELMIKTAFLTLLFNDTFYIMDSETSLERQYADLTMIVRPDMRQYRLSDFLIEFKYVGLKEINLSGEQVRGMKKEQLRDLPPVTAKLKAARETLPVYRDALNRAYKDMLRLKVYTVAAIGLERLVWEEFDASEKK